MIKATTQTRLSDFARRADDRSSSDSWTRETTHTIKTTWTMQGGARQDMPMVSELSLWQQLLLSGLALLSFVYVFYFKIWVTLAAGSDLVFIMALAVAVASIAAPGLFDLAAKGLVDRSALPEALTATDRKIAAIEALPSELIQKALAKLGYETEGPAEEEIAPGPGPFESRIRPSVETLVAVVLRTSSFVISTLLLLMALALRSSTATARALQNLTRRTEELERALADRPTQPASAVV